MSFTLDPSFSQLWNNFVRQADEMAEQMNKRAREAFRGAAENRAVYARQGIISYPKPAAPKAVAARIVMEPFPSVVFVETESLVSDLDPDSLLPKFGTDENAIGGPVGGPIRDEGGKATGRYYLHSSHPNSAPGSVYTSPDGRRFVLIAEGFAGTTRYWLPI